MIIIHFGVWSCRNKCPFRLIVVNVDYPTHQKLNLLKICLHLNNLGAIHTSDFDPGIYSIENFIFSSALMMIVCAWYHSPAGLILNSLTCVLSAITQHPYQNVQVWRRAVRSWNWLTPRINHPGAILKFMMSVWEFWTEIPAHIVPVASNYGNGQKLRLERD